MVADFISCVVSYLYVLTLQYFCLYLQLKLNKDMNSSITSKEDGDWSTDQQMENMKARVCVRKIYQPLNIC